MSNRPDIEGKFALAHGFELEVYRYVAELEAEIEKLRQEIDRLKGKA